MSYPVRVVVKDTVSDVVRTQDRVDLCLCDDPVLKKPQARVILAKTLKDSGWEEKEDGVFATKLDGIEIIWDTNINQLTLVAEEEENLEVEETMTLHGDAWQQNKVTSIEKELQQIGADKIKEKTQKRLEKEKKKKEDELIESIQEKIESKIEEAQAEVNKKVEEVYKEWLEQQAKSLGNIVGKHETDNGDNYELTIKIES